MGKVTQLALRERDSMFRYRGAGDTLKPWYPTDRDRQIVLECSRWAMLTSWDIATRVMPVRDWYVDPSTSSALRNEGLDVSVKAVKRVRERLTRLVNSYPHPLLTGTMRGQFAAVYQATGSGNQFIGIDASPSRISPSAQSYSMTSGHMLTAARVGRCFEINGWRVLSEKESKTGVALDGGLLPPDMQSEYRPNDESKPVIKHPDLILPTPDGDGYVAVEVEMTRYRSPSVYETKLYAYSQNPACKGVIYVTGETSIVERVSAAAAKVFGNNYTDYLIFMQLRPSAGHFGIVRPRVKGAQKMLAQCATIAPDPSLSITPNAAPTTTPSPA